MKRTVAIILALTISVLAGGALAQSGGNPIDERFARAGQWLRQENLSITKTVTQAFTDGYLVVEGEGLPSRDASTPGQKRLTAQRAAEIIAYRNLAQVLDGIAVVGDSTTKDLQMRYDFVRTAVTGFVEGAQVVCKDYNEKDEVALVLVKVGMSGPASFGELMYGKLLDNKEALREMTGGEKVASLKPAPVDAYDGLIIDATAESFRPALINRILTAKGELLYDPSKISQQVLVERGCGEYTNSVAKAKAVLESRGVKNPLVVKAAGTASPTDLKVTNEDSVRIFSANQKAEFLANAKVAFVLK
jgi:hypothetical protein